MLRGFSVDGKARPPATPAEALAAMDRLIATSLVAQHAIAQRLGLNVTDLTCVGHILGAVDAPLTAGELAVRAGVTTGAITGVVNRLESAGFVERRPTPPTGDGCASSPRTRRRAGSTRCTNPSTAASPKSSPTTRPTRSPYWGVADPRRRSDDHVSRGASGAGRRLTAGRRALLGRSCRKEHSGSLPDGRPR